jgi:hypothetical protein
MTSHQPAHLLFRRWFSLPALGLSVGLLGACATQIDTAPAAGASPLRVQNRLLLTPANGGQTITAESLKPGDIILSSTNIYLGDDTVAEAVGAGIRARSTAEFVADESTIVAFRHPGITPEHAARMRTFAQGQVGKKYNTAGVVLQAPFTVQRQLCELPLVPSLIRDACIRGIAAIQLGAVQNDRFFCSQFVLEAYRHAQLPLTDADPRLVSPADLLHMREGDVPSIQIGQALTYVGHLKAGPPVADEAVAAAAPGP